MFLFICKYSIYKSLSDISPLFNFHINLRYRNKLWNGYVSSFEFLTESYRYLYLIHFGWLSYWQLYPVSFFYAQHLKHCMYIFSSFLPFVRASFQPYNENLHIHCNFVSTDYNHTDHKLFKMHVKNKITITNIKLI